MEGREGDSLLLGNYHFLPPMTSITNPHGELSELSDVTGDWEGPRLPPSPRAALAQRDLFLRQQFLLKLHVQVLRLMWLLPPFSTDAPSSLGTDLHPGRQASGQFRKRNTSKGTSVHTSACSQDYAARDMAPKDKDPSL